jgi:hypothetical protein
MHRVIAVRDFDPSSIAFDGVRRIHHSLRRVWQ